MSNKYFESRAQQLGLQLLIENSVFGLEDAPGMKLKGGGRIREYVEGPDKQKWKVHAVVEAAPVTKYKTRSKNGRLYCLELWNRVIELKMAENNLSMIDHPIDSEHAIHSGSGSLMTVAGGWRKFRISEDFGVADLYLVGRNGEHIADILRAGFPVGTSSVGYGEMLESYRDPQTGMWLENVVAPQSFNLERLSDLVANPAQGTMLNVDSMSQHQENMVAKRESITLSESSNTNDTNTSTSEARNSNSMSDNQFKLLEGNAKYQANEHIKLANKALKSGDIVAMTEKLDALKNVQLVVESLPAERQKVLEAQERLESAIAAATESLKEKSNLDAQKLQETEQKLKLSTDMLTEARKQNKQLLAVVEKLGGTPENLEQLKVVEAMQTDIQKFKENEEKYAVNDKLKEAELEIFEKETQKIEADNKQFEAHNKELRVDNEFLVEQIKVRDVEIKSMLEDRMTMEGDVLGILASHENLAEDLKVVELKLAKLQRQMKEMGIDEDPYAAVAAAKKPALKTFPAASGDDRTQGVELASPAMARQAASQGYRMESHKPGKQSFTESFRKADVIRDEIRNFYDQKVQEYPAIERQRKDILGARTLFEAAKLVESFLKDASDPVMRISEDTQSNGGRFTESARAGKKPGWLNGVN